MTCPGVRGGVGDHVGEHHRPRRRFLSFENDLTREHVDDRGHHADRPDKGQGGDGTAPRSSDSNLACPWGGCSGGLRVPLCSFRSVMDTGCLGKFVLLYITAIIGQRSEGSSRI